MNLLEKNEKVLYEKLHIKNPTLLKIQLPLSCFLVVATLFACIYFGVMENWAMFILVLACAFIIFVTLAAILRNSKTYYILTNLRVIHVRKNTIYIQPYDNIETVDFNIQKKHIKFTFNSNPNNLYFFDSKNYNDFTTVLCNYIDIDKTNLKELTLNKNPQ